MRPAFPSGGRRRILLSGQPLRTGPCGLRSDRRAHGRGGDVLFGLIPCARRVRPTRIALFDPTCPACPARTVQFGVRFADSARLFVLPFDLPDSARPVGLPFGRWVVTLSGLSACPVCRRVRPSVCPRSLSVPFSKQKSRTTGTNVLGTARFLEPSDRRNSLRQNPGHVKSRRISHSDSALLLHCFRMAVSSSDSASSDRAFFPFSEKRRCKKTYFFRNPLAKSEEICYTIFGRRLSGCIGVPRTLMQVCHIPVWQTAFFLRSHYSLKKHFCQPVFENYFGFFEKIFQRFFQEKPFMKSICLYKALFRRFSRKVFRKSLAKSRKLCYPIPGRRLSGCMGVPRTPVQVCHIPV